MSQSVSLCLSVSVYVDQSVWAFSFLLSAGCCCCWWWWCSPNQGLSVQALFSFPLITTTTQSAITSSEQLYRNLLPRSRKLDTSSLPLHTVSSSLGHSSGTEEGGGGGEGKNISKRLGFHSEHFGTLLLLSSLSGHRQSCCCCCCLSGWKRCEPLSFFASFFFFLVGSGS